MRKKAVFWAPLVFLAIAVVAAPLLAPRAAAQNRRTTLAFTSPATIRRDELLITVSTGGEAPALAGKIREELEERYGPEYGELIKILGKVREKLLTEKGNSQYNKKVFRSLVAQELPALIKRSAFTEIDHMLRKLCGPGFTLAELGLGEKDK